MTSLKAVAKRYHFVSQNTIVAFVYLAMTAMCSLSLGQQVPLSKSQQLIYDGFTEPLHEIMIASPEVGLIKNINVKLGDSVELGDTIAQLDDELQRSAVAVAKFQSSMTGAVDAALAEVANHQRNVELLDKLASKRMARPDELRNANSDLKVAQSRALAAQEQVELQKRELERFELQLARRRIVAPAAGVISEVFRENGEYVSPSDPVIARLLVINRLVCVFNIPAEEISLVEIGHPVRVLLRSIGRSLDTTIASIAPDIDGESGTVRVRVYLQNDDLSIRSGDRCTLTLLDQAGIPMISRRSDEVLSNDTLEVNRR